MTADQGPLSDRFGHPRSIAEELELAERVRSSPYGEDGPHHRLWPDPSLPLGDAAIYQTVSITSLPLDDAQLRELTGPLDLLHGPGEGSAGAPAEGVILTHEQGWRMEGTTLGRLLHSMTLAPGEVSQIAVSSWERRTSGETREDVAQREYATQQAGRDRGISSVTSAVAHETQFGSSRSTSASAQVDAGVSMLVASASTSSNVASAHHARYSTGARSAKADSREHIRQATQQHAASARHRRATVVQEATTSDSERFSTRVVANYNHQHALNLMYYEVLQVFEFSTRVVEAERCVFLPMEVMDFDVDRVIEFAGPLAEAARQFGEDALAHRIRAMGRASGAGAAAVVARATDRANMAARDLERARDAVIEAAGLLAAARSDLDDTDRQLAEAEATRRRDAMTIRFLRPPPGLPPEQFADVVASMAAQRDLARAELDSVTARIARLEDERGTQQGEVDRAETHLADAKLVQWKAQREVDAATMAVRDAEHAALHHDDDVVAHLNDRRLAYNQAIWLQLRPEQVRALVEGKSLRGESLMTTIDPRPVAVEGNLVGFRQPFGPDRAEQAAAFRKRHVDEAEATVDDGHVVVLPTGAVFAEAVPGVANSAEKIDLTRHWKWDETTIPILPTAISELKQQHHERVQELRARRLGESGARLQRLPDAPPGPGHALAAAISTSMFRDMTGQDVIGSMVEAAQEAAKDGSAEALELAHGNISAFLDHLEELAPKAVDFLSQHAGDLMKQDGMAGLDPTDIGGLENAIGAEGAGLDVGALIGDAAAMGLML